MEQYECMYKHTAYLFRIIAYYSVLYSKQLPDSTNEDLIASSADIHNQIKYTSSIAFNVFVNSLVANCLGSKSTAEVSPFSDLLLRLLIIPTTNALNISCLTLLHECHQTTFTTKAVHKANPTANLI